MFKFFEEHLVIIAFGLMIGGIALWHYTDKKNNAKQRGEAMSREVDKYDPDEPIGM